MDITSIKKGELVSPPDIAIDFVKSLINEPLDSPVPGNLNEIRLIFTCTPKIEKLLKWHIEHNAFDPDHTIDDGRVGYTVAAVHPTCYLAPFYCMQYGRRPS